MALNTFKIKSVFSDFLIDKGLVLKFKEKFNLPNYMLECLLLEYEEEELEEILDKKLIKPKDSLQGQAKLRDKGMIEIIDKIRVRFNKANDRYEGQLINLSIKKVFIPDDIINKYLDLLNNGLWAEIKIVDLSKEGGDLKVEEIRPFYINNFSFEDFQERRAKVNNTEWMNLLLRSIGLEPLGLSQREKLLYLSRLIPFVEKNYNFIELGARGTGKSHLYRQLSKESILISGGKTTVANLFYNMGIKEVGLVGKYNVVAFDEVAYIDFKDKTAIQTLKDYMSSGSFGRGEEEINADASIVLLGNTNKDIRNLVTKGNLFNPLPEMMKDIALIDRFHFYLPGWEMRKLKEGLFSKEDGLINMYISELFKHLRNLDFTGVIDKFFTLDQKFDIRDKKAVTKTVSGFLKLLHPFGDFSKEELKNYLNIALEGRKRVKEQLFKMGSFEYEEINFEYVEKDSGEEYYTSLPEKKLSLLLEEELLPPGTVYIGEIVDNDSFGLIKLELSAKPGKGRLIFLGEADHIMKKSIRKTFLIIKGRRLAQNLRKRIYHNDFYVNIKYILNEIEADIGNAFLVAIYSLLNYKSVTNGLLVTEKSNIYRKSKYNQSIELVSVNAQGGYKKSLFPLKNNIFVEVPYELSTKVTSFITV